MTIIYSFFIKCKRLSEVEDIIPGTISGRLLNGATLKKGMRLCGKGRFCSYNEMQGEHSKLVVKVFVQELYPVTGYDKNKVTLIGTICKPPVYRTTPFNREITDLLIAVNCAYKKSYYIPCIAWGRNARFVRDLSVGDRISVSGRIQSREYQKKLSETETKTMTAYEVSVSKIATFEAGSEFDIEKQFYDYL